MRQIILLLSALCLYATPYAQAQNEESDAYYQQMFELIRSDFEQDMLSPQITSVTLPSVPLAVVKKFYIILALN
ncbi:hypothetical protein [Porphyromonas gulae]|uniref:hypothetical protein n=1 Tax=Porphyromonas gulae TaxID=111105 RepID=UPI0026E9B6CB|nr:hypothetical protein [Porphyromonas gulae]